MAQVLLHSKDSEDKKQQINTTTLSMKSIVGTEKKAFNEISAAEANLEAVQKNTADLTRRLTNVIRNLLLATEKMAALEMQIYISKNRYNAYQNIINNIDAKYAEIPDSWLNARGGRL